MDFPEDTHTIGSKGDFSIPLGPFLILSLIN